MHDNQQLRNEVALGLVVEIVQQQDIIKHQVREHSVGEVLDLETCETSDKSNQ